MEVMVFSTSVDSKDDVRELTPLLNSFAGKGHWNFALDDCDRILRIVSSEVDPRATIRLMNDLGYQCRELDD
ncbi:MAG TPA: hypothetical protein VG737_15380 [Cyclobacteriaceae bacterium]|nr:hypothetical protein [Cyclobacteriaceae bacterium]